jgi:hypothetical protein
MSVLKFGMLIVAGFLIWEVALISRGAWLREGWIPVAALCALMLFLKRKGLRPVAADCPGAATRRLRKAGWIPPRLRY